MTEQVTPEGGALPSDANASPSIQQPEGATEKTESEAGSSPAATEGETKPKPKGEGERIGELTRRWREEQRRSDRLMRQNEELSQRLNQPRPQQQPNASVADPPESADLVERKAKELLQAKDEAARRAAFDSRVDQFASGTEDYDQVVTDNTPVSKNMAEAILDSDNPGEILYYLGKNPDAARKLFDLPITKAAREIGRLEDRLAEERKKLTQKPVSKAPPPTPKIEGTNPGDFDNDTPNSSWSDARYAKWREKQKAQRRSGIS